MIRSEKLLALTFVTITFGAMLLLPSCGTGNHVPDKINVVGMTVLDAGDVLSKEGWKVEYRDQTSNSDYIPGGIENGDITFGKKQVTRVEFADTKKVEGGYATRPKCVIFFESGSQRRLEGMYDDMVFDWEDWLEDLWEGLRQGEDPDVVVKYAWERYKEIRGYDKDDIPYTREDEHEKMIERYEELLNACGYTVE